MSSWPEPELHALGSIAPGAFSRILLSPFVPAREDDIASSLITE